MYGAKSSTVVPSVFVGLSLVPSLLLNLAATMRVLWVQKGLVTIHVDSGRWYYKHLQEQSTRLVMMSGPMTTTPTVAGSLRHHWAT